MDNLVAMTAEEFNDLLDDALIGRALIRINRVFIPDRALLSWSSVGDGMEAFKWKFVNHCEHGNGGQGIHWVPSVTCPLSGEQRDKVLSGNGASVLLPLVVTTLDTVPGAMVVGPSAMKISSDTLGMVELT